LLEWKEVNAGIADGKREGWASGERPASEEQGDEMVTVVS